MPWEPARRGAWPPRPWGAWRRPPPSPGPRRPGPRAAWRRPPPRSPPRPRPPTLAHLVEAQLSAQAAAEGPLFTRPHFARRVPNGDRIRARHKRDIAAVWEAYWLERASRGLPPDAKWHAEAAAALIPAEGSQKSLTASIMWASCSLNPEVNPRAETNYCAIFGVETTPNILRPDYTAPRNRLRQASMV